MEYTKLCRVILFVAATVTLAHAQWNPYPNTYVTYPTTYYQPTFSGLNGYTTASPYLGQRVRIWPYILGQYYQPYYNQYTSNYNNGFDTNSNNYYNSFLNHGNTKK